MQTQDETPAKQAERTDVMEGNDQDEAQADSSKRTHNHEENRTHAHTQHHTEPHKHTNAHAHGGEPGIEGADQSGYCVCVCADCMCVSGHMYVRVYDCV